MFKIGDIIECEEDPSLGPGSSFNIWAGLQIQVTKINPDQKSVSGKVVKEIPSLRYTKIGMMQNFQNRFLKLVKRRETPTYGEFLEKMNEKV